MAFKLHPETQMGAVSLNIRDMDRSLKFYIDNLGFQVQGQDGNTTELGAGGETLLILNEYPDAPAIERSAAGLYHYAILVPSRVELGKSLHRLIETQTPVQGFADHIVSEAIYLGDPDGIGIEIYRDLPRNTWQFNNGEIVMDSLQLDLQGILDELSPEDTQWKGLHKDTRIGHVHLNTGRNTDLSKRFYVEKLGFDPVMSIGGYWHFISAGGYHHHLGLRPSDSRKNLDSIGLDWYAIDLPDTTALQAAADHLKSTGVELNTTDAGYQFYDHANNGIHLRVKAS